uniref:NADH dehydrogenase [ubiquinone] 1 beta subcomplex subunit 5, mitochondrial n=1 Tax=Panagrolaimus sp. ES5 TaxID=591445 RepID=A0AC34GMY3_9BILA
MTHLSKLAPCGALARSTFGKLFPQSLSVQSIRLSHSHLFRRRNGQLIVNRIKDMAHFYMIALGSLPFLFACAYTHIVYGPCELKDYPEEGQPPPRYWQYERTPLRQWFVKWIGQSDMEHHERNLAYFERQGILTRWRRTEDRVKHLQGEFADYKGYFYMPVSAQWIDYGRYMANRQRDQYESHASYGN